MGDKWERIREIERVKKRSSKKMEGGRDQRKKCNEIWSNGRMLRMREQRRAALENETLRLSGFHWNRAVAKFKDFFFPSIELL